MKNGFVIEEICFKLDFNSLKATSGVFHQVYSFGMRQGSWFRYLKKQGLRTQRNNFSNLIDERIFNIEDYNIWKKS